MKKLIKKKIHRNPITNVHLTYKGHYILPIKGLEFDI
jgi:aspartate 1-decarboxylase